MISKDGLLIRQQQEHVKLNCEIIKMWSIMRLMSIHIISVQFLLSHGGDSGFQ